MTNNEIVKMIKRHEGGPHDVYLDSVGIPTLGWGHALHPGSFVPQEVSEIFFSMDFETAVDDAEFIIGKYDIEIDDIRKWVLINMAFQLGRSRLMAFKKMLAALIIKDYDEAAAQILDSKAAQQCQNRYKELAKIMKTGLA
uniref:Glycoside hydrolase n=1 Tax=viral metagenome TaxID=1070528 RepID=A0A6M3LL08_9ZZZZ